MPASLHALEHLADLFWHLAIDPIRDELGVSENGVERRPQLVGHPCEEFRLVAAGEFQLLAFFLQRPEQARVLHRQRGLAGKGSQQLDGLARELPGMLSAHQKGADGLLLAYQRHGQQGPVSGADQDVTYMNSVRPLCGDIRDLEGSAGLHHAAPHAFSLPQGSHAQGFNQFLLEVLGRPQMQLFRNIVVLVDQASFGSGELSGTGDDGGEHGVEIERRADRTANLGERLELLDRSSEIRSTRLQLLEQAYVLDGDCRVRGEGRQYLDRVRGDRGTRVLVVGQRTPTARPLVIMGTTTKLFERSALTSEYGRRSCRTAGSGSASSKASARLSR